MPTSYPRTKESPEASLPSQNVKAAVAAGEV